MIVADVSGVNISLLSGKSVYYINVINSSSIRFSGHTEETESTVMQGGPKKLDHFYRAMLRRARLWDCMSSVRPSVCP